MPDVDLMRCLVKHARLDVNRTDPHGVPLVPHALSHSPARDGPKQTALNTRTMVVVLESYQVLACKDGRLEMVKTLIEELNADWTIHGYTYDEGRSPACVVQIHSALRLPLKCTGVPSLNRPRAGDCWRSPLTAAAERGHLEVVQYLVKQGDDPHATHSQPSSHTAAHSAHSPPLVLVYTLP
jgi:hypothetical protein